ncbi:MAG: efflux RND transporter periplasmic adaptor subunit [Candidatus Margulisiibacteriota bacterium]|nr:efflux RND transporter periplasmic adaptor subunit [Candidatus Margulisiibacteriota bacterium]
MNLKKIALIIGMIILALVAFRFLAIIFKPKEVQQERVVSVITAQPKEGRVQEKITLTGDVKALKEVSVRPRVAARVAEIYVNEGDYVKKGDKLMSYLSGIDDKNDIYEDMIVRAPISGVVGMKLVKVGDQVSTSVNSQPAAVFVLYNIDEVRVEADVPEKYYSFVRKGTPAQITLDALPGQEFNGKVNIKRPVIDPQTRTARIEISIANASRKLKPGMFSRVSLIIRQNGTALVIPFDAVLGDDGNKYVYTVSPDNTAHKRTVALGLQQDGQVEVLSGLSARDRIIVVGQAVVKEGGKVKENGND